MMDVIITLPKYRDRYGADHVKGDSVAYPDHVAVKLIGLGYAKAAPKPEPKPVPKVETVEKAPPENAAKRTAKPAPRKGAK